MEAGAGRQIRLLLQQLANELTQLQLASQGDRGGQQQGLGRVAVVGGHQVDGGQIEERWRKLGLIERDLIPSGFG